MRVALYSSITILTLLPAGGGSSSQLAFAEETMFSVARVKEGKKACWALRQPPAHPHIKTSESILGLSMALQYQLEAYPEHNPARQLLFYELAVSFHDGRRGTATGNCLMSGARTMTCAVECDGGGIDIVPSPEGSLEVSLDRTGFIRMGYCGRKETLQLTAARHGNKLVLDAIPAAQCPDLVQPDPNAGID